MWDHKNLLNIDLRQIILILFLMGISLLVISSMTSNAQSTSFVSSYVKNQIQWFILGWIVFIFFAGFVKKFDLIIVKI